MRVLVAMSGGVDSSVTAALLHRQGHEVVGVTMRLWTKLRDDAPLHHRGCCSIEDTDDARRVANVMGFPYYVLNFENEFEEKVVDYFVDEYRRGRTPNPCLACNQHVKFDALLRRAEALECDLLATGHYARVESIDGRPRLLRAVDRSKDQSYVLYTLSEADLGRLAFPLGGMTKTEVRAIASEMGLLNVAAKPDSQEICFLQGRNYREFVQERAGDQQSGDLLDEGGAVIGRHAGIAGYTIGQRRGLGIAAPEPRYVIGIDEIRNTVTIGRGERLLHSRCTVEGLHWIGTPPAEPFRAMAKVRYKASETAGTIHPMTGVVQFDEPQRAITPGQAIVFYDGEVVLGGGVIASAA